MAQHLTAWSPRQTLDENGDPRVGAKLFSYVSSATGTGGTTKQTLTQDAAGNTNHSNPMILNAYGEPSDSASGASMAMWQPSGVYVKLVLAPASDTDPPTSAISTWDNLPGINDTTTTIDQWISGAAPTFVSTTSFTLVGDQTTEFHVGRRLKTTNTAGTIYSTIITSAYTSLTTITVVNDSGVLDSGLSSVFYGILTATNQSVTPDGFIPILGPDIASATALPYPAYGNYSDVTGTNTITSFATSGRIGTIIKRHFDGILTLTHHATDLILPGGTITTAAGDEAEFIEYASGDWRCTNYKRADGRSVIDSIVSADLPAGSVVQVVNVMDGAVATGTTAFPADDTIPQNTEGDEYMTLAITPTSATNKLRIDVVTHLATTTGNNFMSAALFQDSTAGALAAKAHYDNHTTVRAGVAFTYYMTSGTASSTTFKVRAGAQSGTTTFNGSSSARLFGGVAASSITIMEIQV